MLSPELARTTDFDQQLRLASLSWSSFQGEDLMALVGEIEAFAEEIENTGSPQATGQTEASENES